MKLVKKVKVKFRRIVCFFAFFMTIGTCILLGAQWGLSKSDWAAWIQAIGSVAAIFSAIWIVQLQFQRELKNRMELDRSIRRRQLNVLRWVFISVAEICDKSASKVNHEHVSWELEAEIISDKRKLLSSIGLLEFPDAMLLVRAQEINHQMQLAQAVVASLKQPREEKIRNHVADILHEVRNSALVGVTEITKLLVECSTKNELDAEWKLLDSRKQTEAMTKRVYEEIKNKTTDV